MAARSRLSESSRKLAVVTTRSPAAAPPPAPAGAASLYTCPMHPEFVTPDAGARCPKCGMRLVPQPPAAGGAGAHEAARAPGAPAHQP